MFGKKVTARELQRWGLISEIFPATTFHNDIKAYLTHQLDVNDGASLLLARKLQNGPLRTERMIALYDAADALSERFVDDAPISRFIKKRVELKGNKPTKTFLYKLTVV